MKLKNQIKLNAINTAKLSRLRVSCIALSMVWFLVFNVYLYN